MELKDLFRYRTHFIIAFLAIFVVLTLWIRLLPLASVGPGMDVLNFAGSDDPLYNLRQIEQMLHNYPTYAWFDPMTLFPSGTTVHWGPLLIWLCSTVCMVAGATSAPGYITVSLMVPTFLAAAMVPVVFLISRKIADWKAGVAAALLIAVIGGQYFFRSFFGYLDHHIAEVFFASLFSLLYIVALHYTREHPIDFRKMNTLLFPAAFSVGSGIAYILGLFTMPTMILLAFVVGIFTLVQFIWDFWRKHAVEYLLFVNIITFGLATLLFFLVGPTHPGLQLDYYTLGHPLAYLLVIIFTIFLYAVARVLTEKPAYYYLGAIGIAAFAFLSILFIAFPEVFQLLIQGIIQFFGQNPYSLTVQEARSWTLEEAWITYNFGLILMFIGFAILAYTSWKQERPDRLYILIWSIVIFIATWQHVRYEYYLAANLAILAGVTVGFFLDLGTAGLCNLPRRRTPGLSGPESAGGEQGPSGPTTEAGDQEGSEIKLQSSETPEGKSGGSRQPKGKKAAKGTAAKGKKADTDQKSASRSQKKPVQKKKEAGPKPDYVKLALLSAILILTGLFVYLSLVSELAVAESTAIRMNPDWRESMEWMRNSTPDTGVDYYKIYAAASFSYPPQSYGVMSWWDYGHLMTYLAHRIPNANPFQAGVAGANGSAAFFMAPDESTANAILTALGTKYVVTDIEMDTGKFWAMATWYNSTLGATPYHPIFLIPSPEDPQQLQDVMILDDAYYQTIVSRLHNFDGSMTAPTNAVYIEYTDANVAGQPLPVISDVLPIEGAANVTAAQSTAANYNANAQPGYHAVVGNPAWSSILDPVATIPALQHYRLVHESPNNVFQVQTPDVRYVKTFEFVPGAHIRGDGIIELDVVSDGGRNFTYRQASTNGEFIVPYSTTGNPYGVKAVGKYRISGTGREIDVPESAIQSGGTIQA